MVETLWENERDDIRRQWAQPVLGVRKNQHFLPRNKPYPVISKKASAQFRSGLEGPITNTPEIPNLGCDTGINSDVGKFPFGVPNMVLDDFCNPTANILQSSGDAQAFVSNPLIPTQMCGNPTLPIVTEGIQPNFSAENLEYDPSISLHPDNLSWVDSGMISSGFYDWLQQSADQFLAE